MEDYPDYIKGSCVLVLQHDGAGQASHAVWGIARGSTEPAVLIRSLSARSRKMDGGFQAEKIVSTRRHTKLLHEGDYVAEVEVELIDADADAGAGWGPYLSLEDVRKLDSLRVALRQGDIASALKCARVYRLTPITAAG